MSVRAASFEDNWKKVFRRNYSEHIKTISIENSQALDSTKLVIEKGILAIVGGNGVGKSTLAHTVAEGLLNTAGISDLTSQHHRIYGAEIKFEFQANEQLHSRHVTFSKDGKIINGDETLACNWIDPSLFSTMCRQQILQDLAFEDVLDGITPQKLPEKDLELASYIVGKDYNSCEVWEITEYGPLETWPYFRVRTSDIEYGSETMGQGELALLTALWAVRRSPDNSVIIIEEPETHVSSRSQLSFMDFLAREGGDRGISFLLTTHSPVILQRIPLENTYLVLAGGHKSNIITPPRAHHVASLLGGGISHKALIIVEDNSAKAFCEALIENIDPDFYRQITFSVCTDGESEIVKILKTMPRIQGWATLIGCFDGDQRERHRTLELPWPHVFLPGTLPPDQILKSSFQSLNFDKLSQELRVEVQDLKVAAAASAGIDFHDWARHLSANLNIEQNAFTKSIAKLWSLNNIEPAKDFITSIKQAL